MLRKPAFSIVLSPVAKQLEFYPFHGHITPVHHFMYKWFDRSAFNVEFCKGNYSINNVFLASGTNTSFAYLAHREKKIQFPR